MAASGSVLLLSASSMPLSMSIHALTSTASFNSSSGTAMGSRGGVRLPQWTRVGRGDLLTTQAYRTFAPAKARARSRRRRCSGGSSGDEEGFNGGGGSGDDCGGFGGGWGGGRGDSNCNSGGGDSRPWFNMNQMQQHLEQIIYEGGWILALLASFSLLQAAHFVFCLCSPSPKCSTLAQADM